MPLEFLADRSLGKRVVTSLREAGLTIHTLADVFGEADSQLVEDTNWIAYAGSHHWACLTKDRRIRHVTIERDCVVDHGVKLFALANANLSFAEMIAEFLAARHRMADLCADENSGGQIWVVQRDGRLELVWPQYD
ncbi:hypothetical protein [Dactylosporangium sp. NPDC051484]|uniref:PIN-like domain-containing protein n=1 Tax=Dactylosporangium sp. NPDC051484 TaxID=3154942 RepID=UPI00344BB09E